MIPRFTRRHALQVLTSLGGLAVSGGASPTAPSGGALRATQAGGLPADQSKRWKGSALGNLYPFIKEEQQRTRQRLAFLNRRPKDLGAWKAECREKVFAALVYRPAPSKPGATILERVDRGDYIRERLTFQTAPSVTVPAYLLVPKRAKLPAPAVIALHDHSGLYYWGKEKIIETEKEHPVLIASRQRHYDGVSYPAMLARHGYVVLTIDMYYFGDRRLVLDEDLERGINDHSKVESQETIDQINDRNGKAENEHPALTAFRQRAYDGVSYPATLARHGHVVLTIDMYYFGDRRLVLDEDLERGVNDHSKIESEETINQINGRNGKMEHVIYKNMIDAGVTWAGVLAWDDIRSIDYLVTRPEVDPRRIACTGLSVGGFRTNFLAGLDPRIKASCVAGWMTSFRNLLPRYESYTVPAGWPPGLLDDLDYPDVGSLTVPNPMMVVHGWQDTLFPPEGVRAAFNTLAKCYDAIGKPERFQTFTFDGPHKFPLEAQQRMMAWFDRWV